MSAKELSTVRPDRRCAVAHEQPRPQAVQSKIASTNHSRAARRATSAAHSGCLVQTEGAASAAWRPLAVLAAAWGFAAAAPPNPAKVCAASMAAVGGRRAPRRSRAALPACPPQPPVRRLLPLAFVPPAGAGEPPRSHSAWRPARRSWRGLRRGPGVTGGTRLTALFRPPCRRLLRPLLPH